MYQFLCVFLSFQEMKQSFAGNFMFCCIKNLATKWKKT